LRLVLSATLDTSCALNFLGEDEETSDALVDAVAAAMAGRVNLRVTEQAYDEVSRTTNEERRQERLTRLRTFGRVELPVHRHAERNALADRLHDTLFPAAQSTSRTDAHNQRDCLQLATHSLAGRDLFVTRDTKLRKRAGSAASVDITVVGPEELVERLAEERRQGRLPSAPAIAVRDAVPDQDEAAIREVLAPLANDYPDFAGWLNRALQKAAVGETRIRVGLVGGRVGAVALSTRKDDRVVKLSAFYVTESARDAGLGQHLLWSEIRSWANSSIEKAYVTVSSRHGELIDFFRTFGFLIEGISPRRYQADTGEIVLGKHLVRRVVGDAELDLFATDVASRVFSAPSSVTPNPWTWALAPQATHPRFEWRGAGAAAHLVARDGDVDLRSWGLLELETIFHPVRFALTERQALVVPIRPEWAEAMLDYTDQQLSLLAAPDRSEKLLLRSENAYYCYPTALRTAAPGTPILFLVTGGVGLVGEAKIIDAVVDSAEELFARFGGLGIYGIQEIRGHTRKRGKRAGHALAMHFGSYVPFEESVTRDQMRATLGRNLQVQTITPIPGNEFEMLRRIGGLSW
jgi:N-acetylglutamate synthase-like GNAT family acetyltransferase